MMLAAIFSVCLILVLVARRIGAHSIEPFKAELTIRADQPKGTINRNIYGHFAEHLGRCIYEGIWVGEDSTIANTRGIRNDVVAALRKLNVTEIIRSCAARGRPSCSPNVKRETYIISSPGYTAF
jgi:hypothetical protein